MRNPFSIKLLFIVSLDKLNMMTLFFSALFRSLTSDLDDVNMTVRSGAKLQLVFGDITDETTDAVVNTTDFITFDSGKCFSQNPDLINEREGRSEKGE